MDIKYLAGFFDGEGSVGVYSSGNSNGNLNGNLNGHSLKVQLTQRESLLSEKFLREIVSDFGGSVGKHKNELNWQIGSTNAEYFLKKIIPHLILKKNQAEIALEWHISKPKIARGQNGCILKISNDQIEKTKKVVQVLRSIKNCEYETLSNFPKYIDSKYIAGFFDGEGCVGLYRPKKARKYYVLRSQLVQNETTSSSFVYSELQREYGGKINKAQTYTGNTKMNWMLSNIAASEFLKDIVDHLVFKKDQAELAIEWADKLSLPKRDAITGRMLPLSEERIIYSDIVAQKIKMLKC
jgi:intein/homing endonuclease